MSFQRNEQSVYTRNRGFKYRAEYSGGVVIYQSWSDPHFGDSELKHQILKHTYDASNQLTSSDWAQNSAGVSCDDFIFSWTLHATYTYGP